MNDVSVLIGGKAGEGINSAGAMVAQLLNHCGYSVYLYLDYPSLIRGGHNYAIIRGTDTETSPATCRGQVDFLLALDQLTVEKHVNQLGPGAAILFNADLVKGDGQPVQVGEILKKEGAPAIMGNSALLGGFARAAGIPWETVEQVFLSHIPKQADLNLKVARSAYDGLETVRTIPRVRNAPRPLLTGNEAIGIGLVRGGLDAYVSYPMTPSSGVLHFLAAESKRFGITVVHPENEIAVILMALGFAAAGKRSAVGTSGGGFCLMTEGLSLAGMAELPVVIVMSQRTGPSTGLPTYTGQADLRFVLHAGQGEFPRLVVAPADANEAILLSARAMDLSWRFQVPAFILVDKTLSEGIYSTDLPALERSDYLPAPAGGEGKYRRYADTRDGVSPPAYAGSPGAVVKVNSYAHDDYGITIEDAAITERMTEKRVRKEQALVDELEKYPQVLVHGKKEAPVALLSWGSTGGVCDEVAGLIGLRVIRPVILSPFPYARIQDTLKGVTRLIAVEENSTGQLAAVCAEHGIIVHHRILRYDGRPFTPDGLAARVQEVLS